MVRIMLWSGFIPNVPARFVEGIQLSRSVFFPIIPARTGKATVVPIPADACRVQGISRETDVEVTLSGCGYVTL